MWSALLDRFWRAPAPADQRTEVLDVDAVVVSEGDALRRASGRLRADARSVQLTITPEDAEPAVVTIEAPELLEVVIDVTELGEHGEVGPFVSVHLEDHDLLVRVADPEAVVAAIRGVQRGLEAAGGPDADAGDADGPT
jgi:hypothetical protein